MLRPQGVPKRRARPGLRGGGVSSPCPTAGGQEMNDDACACMAAYYHEYWFAGVAPWGAGRRRSSATNPWGNEAYGE